MPIIFKNGKLYRTSFSHNNSNPNHKENGNGNNNREQGNSPRIIDLSMVLPQALLGGEDSIEPLHWYHPNLEFNDKELHDKLWKGWTLNYEQAIGRGKECKMQVILSFQAGLEDPKQIKKHYQRSIEYHEEYVKCEFIKTIRIIEASLNAMNGTKASTSMIDKLIKKSDMGLVDSLAESLRIGEEWKMKGNLAGKNGKHDIAIKNYLEGLVSIWPWTSSDSSIDFEQASKSGLIKLEQALLNNIITISLSHPAKSGIKKTTFDNIARVTCELMLEFRYITVSNLRKTFERLAQLDEREYGIKGKDGVNKLMADMFKDKNEDGWAHKDCIRQHVCHE